MVAVRGRDGEARRKTAVVFGQKVVGRRGIIVAVVEGCPTPGEMREETWDMKRSRCGFVTV